MARKTKTEVQVAKEPQKKNSQRVQGRRHTWTARTEEIDFSRNQGGFYAVELTLDRKNADKLQKDIVSCLKTAERFNSNQIQIIAHWGKSTQGGYLLRTRIKAA